MLLNGTANHPIYWPSDGEIRGRFFYVQRRGASRSNTLRYQPGTPLVFYMTKINIDTNLFSHPKMRRLRMYCGKGAELNLIKLWCYAAEYHSKDGSFEGYGKSEIEGMADWDGTPGNFIEALEKLSLIDKTPEGIYKIHDWKIHAGFVWDYKIAGQEGARKRWKKHNRQSFSKHSPPISPPNGPPIGDPNAMEWNGMEWNKDVIGVPPKPPTDIQKIVLTFKIVSGYAKDDKSWDKLNFARFSKSAKGLLDFFGNWKDAADCVQETYEKLTSKGLTVTLETISKHAADWKKDKQEKNGILSV